MAKHKTHEPTCPAYTEFADADPAKWTMCGKVVPVGNVLCEEHSREAEVIALLNKHRRDFSQQS